VSAWREICLGDLGRIVTGKTPSTSVSDYFGGDVPFVTPSDMFGHKVISRTARCLTNAGVAAVKGSFIPKGSVMVSCIGSDMGNVTIAAHDCVSNQQINSIVVSEQFSGDFIYYNLSTRKAELQSMACSGSAQPILNKGYFSQLPIVVPPLPEQRAIASVLGLLDDKIELNRRMNETLEALAQSLFKSWFVDATQSALPKGWRAGTLDEVAENPRRGIQPDEIKPDTAYIGLEHMPRRSIALSDWGHTEKLESNKFEFKHREILFGKLRPYFHKVGVAPLDGVCSTDILVSTPKEPAWFGLVLGHVSSVELVNHTNAASTGTKMPRANWNDISRYEVALPPKQLAADFTEKIRPLVERIIANIHESRTLAALRDALLPKLLSGELRVAKAEEIGRKAA
jgi:type I restriction enzyme, S subunit